MAPLSCIYLYRDHESPNYQISEIAAYIHKFYPRARLKERDEFFQSAKREGNLFNIDEAAKEIVLCRVHNPNQEVGEFSPLPLEIEYEKKRLTNSRQLKGIIYDGFRLQLVYKKYILPEEQNLWSCHLIFTNQLLASFDENDKRYHLRVAILGFPNLISSAGLVEALAKPRQYYLQIQMGEDPLVLKAKFKDKIIDYGDERITDFLKNYCLQALFYHLTGSAFCKDKYCRLYNAHWQQELIEAQAQRKYELCPQHAAVVF